MTDRERAQSLAPHLVAVPVALVEAQFLAVRQDERRRIVAWLHQRGDRWRVDTPDGYAHVLDAVAGWIERGEASEPTS